MVLEILRDFELILVVGVFCREVIKENSEYIFISSDCLYILYFRSFCEVIIVR